MKAILKRPKALLSYSTRGQTARVVRVRYHCTDISAGVVVSAPLVISFAPFVLGAPLPSAAGRLASAAGSCAWSTLLSPCSLLLFSLPSLVPLGREGCDFLGGDLTSTFSWVFWAELCVGRIILSRKLPDGACVLAMLIRDLGAFGLSAGLDPAGREARDVFPTGGLGFEVVRPRVTTAAAGGAPSSLAAEAAVGAVAEAGRRTGRVGDFGLGFTNAGDVGPGFLTAFPVDVVDTGVGLGTVLVGGFDTADGRLVGLFSSFGVIIFCSFGGFGFGAAVFAGEAAFDSGCLPDAFALVGVRGTVGAVFSCLVSEASGAAGGAGDVAG